MNATLAEERKKLAQMSEQLAAAAARNAETEGIRKQYDAELKERDKTMAQLELESEKQKSQFATLNEKVNSLVKEREQHAVELKHAREAHTQLVTALKEAEEKVTRTLVDPSAGSRVKELEAQAASLREKHAAEIQQRDARLAQLQQELEAQKRHGGTSGAGRESSILIRVQGNPEEAGQPVRRGAG